MVGGCRGGSLHSRGQATLPGSLCVSMTHSNSSEKKILSHVGEAETSVDLADSGSFWLLSFFNLTAAITSPFTST